MLEESAARPPLHNTAFTHTHTWSEEGKKKTGAAVGPRVIDARRHLSFLQVITAEAPASGG